MWFEKLLHFKPNCWKCIVGTVCHGNQHLSWCTVKSVNTITGRNAFSVSYKICETRVFKMYCRHLLWCFGGNVLIPLFYCLYTIIAVIWLTLSLCFVSCVSTTPVVLQNLEEYSTQSLREMGSSSSLVRRK